MPENDERSFVDSTRRMIYDIQKLVEPVGWVIVTEKRREGRIDEFNVSVSFKFKESRNQQ